MRKLIVNADDFGLTQGINKGIIHGFRLGIISSATAMVNMPCWAHASSLAGKLAGLGIGLHFNLTLGSPLTDPQHIPTLVTDAGEFHNEAGQLAAAASQDVARELSNQYSYLLRSGIKPTHIDSHQGIHRLDNVLPVLLDFAACHKLPLRLIPQARSRYETAGVATTGEIIDAFRDKAANRLKFESLLSNCRAETVELRCHPGRMDADLHTFSPYTWQRERELAVICAYTKEEFSRRYDFELIPFSRLG